MFSERGSLVENLLKVAGAVDNDVEPLFHHVPGDFPLKLIGAFRYLVKWDVVAIEEGGPDDVMIDDQSANRSP